MKKTGYGTLKSGDNQKNQTKAINNTPAKNNDPQRHEQKNLYRGEFSNSNQLNIILDKYSPKILSMDCFDTLLWRSVHQPSDIFLEMEQIGLFKELGLTAHDRIKGEIEARNKKNMKFGTDEVTLTEIYLEVTSGLNIIADCAIGELIEEEISIERMRIVLNQDLAKVLGDFSNLGEHVAITSDTYLSKIQLTNLLEFAFEQTNLSFPNFKVFTSVDYGIGKRNGLMRLVANSLNTDAGNILHVGDNQQADVKGALLSGTQAALYEQFPVSHSSSRRNARNMARLIARNDSIMTASKDELKIFDTFNITKKIRDSVPSTLVADLAKIYTHFASEVFKEAQRVGARKILLMMRDSHLLGEVASILKGANSVNAEILDFYISRYAANIISLTSDVEISELALWMCSQKATVKDIERQFLLPHGILKARGQERLPSVDAYQQLTSVPISKLILNAAGQYRDEFSRYFIENFNISHGDKVLLVDLGYAATIQRKIQNFLEQGLGVDAHGLYLIGTFKPDSLRARTIMSGHGGAQDIKCITSNISILEQLSMRLTGSTISYSEANVVQAPLMIPQEQQVKIRQCQTAVADVIREALNNPDLGFPSKIGSSAETKKALLRLLFASTDEERRYLFGFHHDIGLGSDEVVNIASDNNIRSSASIDGVLMHQYPMLSWSNSVRSTGFVSHLAYLSAVTCGLDIRRNDLNLYDQNFRFIRFNGDEQSWIPSVCIDTHDGYQALVCHILGDITALGIMVSSGISAFQMSEIRIRQSSQSEREVVRVLDLNDPGIQYEGLRRINDSVIERHAKSSFMLIIIPPIFKHADGGIEVKFVWRDISVTPKFSTN